MTDWRKVFRDGDSAAYWLLHELYRSLGFPALPLEQSLSESVSKRVIDNAANWIGMRRPEPSKPGRVFSAEAVATLRRRYGASALPE